MNKTISERRRPLESAGNRFSIQHSAFRYQAKAEASVTKKIKLVLLMFLAFMLLQVSLCAAAGTLDWAMRAGGSSGADVGKSVAVLPDNTAIVTGYFVGTATFGPGEVNETIFTGGGMFLAKYNTNGSLAWAKQVSGAWGYSVAALPDGTSFVTGPFIGTVTFGLNESNQTTLTATTSYTNIYVAKYNANGTLAWATRAGSTGVDDARSIAALADGSCLVTGLYSDTATFDQSVLAHTGVGYNMFVAKYNPSGTLAWAKGIPGSGTHDSLGYGIGTLADGSSIVTGTFSGTAIFGQSEVNQTSLLANGSDHDMFVARYNANGTLAWARSAGSSGYYDEGNSVAVLADGSALVAGYFYSSATFGQGNQTTLTSAGGGDAFVAKYDPAGTLVWVGQAGGTGNADQAHGISALADGSFFISGYFNGTAIFGPGETNQTSLTAVGSVDIDLFVAKYHANGSLAWARSAGGSTKDLASGIAALTDGSAIVTGGYSTTAVFGQGDPNQTSLFSAGTCSGYGCNYDIFVAKYNDTPGCVDPPSGMTGWWPLDDLSDAPSIVGNHTGIFAGSPLPSSIAGMVSNALTFNGSNWVSVQDSNSLDLGTSDFSVDAWVNPGDTSGIKSIIDKRVSSGGVEYGYHVYLYDGRLGGRLADGTTGCNSGGSNYYVPNTSPYVISANTGWHFVGVSVDRSSGITFTVDGNPYNINYFNGCAHSASLANTANLLIGGHFTPGSAFVGGIDEVELFDRALSGAEMLDIYNAGAGGKCTQQNVSIPQTRQTTCYNSSGVATTCATTGQDGEIQAGVAWPGLRFTNPTGAPTPLSGDIVLDNLTGLQWTRDAGTPGTVVCTGGTGCSGNYCTGSGRTWLQALDYVACLNGANAYGYNDWRLPNINELAFVNAGQSSVAGWLTAQGFTNVQTQNYYWSSTTAAGSTAQAWSMDFISGIVDYDSKTFNYYVWPVRAGQGGVADPAYPANIWKTGQTQSYYANDDGALLSGVNWPSPRFTDNGDQTITDNLTELIWAKDASTPSCTFGGNTLSGQMGSWQDALSYVQCLNNLLPDGYHHYTDWRLPNINELHSLVDHSNYAPALPGVSWFSGSQFTGVHSDHYWSSTARVGAGLNMTNPNDAWTVDFWGGGVYNNNPASRLPYVLPVRGGSGGALCLPVNAGAVSQVTPVTGLSLNFANASVNTGGCISAQQISTTAPSNFQIAGGASYDINFIGAFTGTVTVCIDYDPTNMTNPQIWHNTGTAGNPVWVSLNTASGYPMHLSTTPPVDRICADTASFSEFAVMTPLLDTTPDPFTFTDQTDVALNKGITSNAITVTGINAPAPISLGSSTGYYSVSTNGGATWSVFSRTAPATLNLNDKVRVRLISSLSYSTTKDVTLTIGGVSDTFSVTTIGNSVPTPNFTAACDSVVSNKMNFNASSSTCPSGYTCTYSWSTGETSETASHTFSSSGTYPVTLTVTATGGGSASVTKSITTCTVNQAPTCAIVPGSLSIDGRTVSFLDNSSDDNPDTAVLTVDWGDTNTTTYALKDNPSHTYAYNGDYRIRPRVRDEGRKINMCAPIPVTVPATFKATVNMSKATAYTSVKVLLNGSIKSQGSTGAAGLTWTSALLPANANYTLSVTKAGKTFSCNGATVDLSTGNQTVACTVTP